MADELFTSEVNLVNDQLVIAVRGEIDMSNAAAFAELLMATVETASCAVVLDASGIDYLDSSGARRLVNAATHARERSVRFVVRDTQPRIRRVLEVLGLTELLEPPI